MMQQDIKKYSELRIADWWTLEIGSHIFNYSNLGKQRYSKKKMKVSFKNPNLAQNKKIPYYKVNDEIYNMILCLSDSFWKGHEKEKDNKPKKITIEKSFLLGETEITQELYVSVMGTNPSEFKDNPKNPVGKVSWYDAVMFCNKLSDIFGLDRYYTIFKDGKSIDTIEKKQDYVVGMNEDAKGFRLPTEWEWEYAAKAGTDLELEYSGSNNADDVGCYSGINKVGTHPIKQKKSNAWGFYDMSGNVREWCESRYDSTSEHRVIRGDDWESKQRVAYRWSADPSSLHFSFGFRICKHI